MPLSPVTPILLERSALPTTRSSMSACHPCRKSLVLLKDRRSCTAYCPLLPACAWPKQLTGGKIWRKHVGVETTAQELHVFIETACSETPHRRDNPLGMKGLSRDKLPHPIHMFFGQATKRPLGCPPLAEFSCLRRDLAARAPPCAQGSNPAGTYIHPGFAQASLQRRELRHAATIKPKLEHQLRLGACASPCPLRGQSRQHCPVEALQYGAIAYKDWVGFDLARDLRAWVRP